MQKERSRFRRVVGTLLVGYWVAACIPPPVASAQTVAASSDSPALEEIIVTARRREENIQTVPIAITVVSEQALQENNVQTFGDLQYLVPSMSASTGTSRDAPNVSIRGQGQNGPNVLPGVEAYLNEVPIPSDNEGLLAGGPGLLFDLENIQVLKGPQGTLFGRNSVGGALLLRSARPTNDFEGYLQATYGNYNDRELTGAINLPIANQTLLARVAFSGQLRDGFTHIASEPGYPGGIDADNRDAWSVRGTVTFHPIDQLQNDLIVTYSTYKSNGSPLLLTNLNPTGVVAMFFPSILPLFAEQQALGVRDSVPQSVHLDSSGSNLSMDDILRFDITEELAVRYLFGLDAYHYTFALDIDGTALPIVDYVPPNRDATRQLTNEVQLVGKAFASRLDWQFGAFYLDRIRPENDYSFEQTTVLFGGPPTFSPYQAGENSRAIYGQGTYDLSSVVTGLRLTAGARYTWDNRSRIGGVLPVSPNLSAREIDSALTWTAGIEYQAAPNTLLYVTSRRGYRAGGTNGVNSAGAPLPNYAPEFVKDIELGIKSDWRIADVPVRTNADVYYQDYTNDQVQQVFEVVTNGTLVQTSIINNAAAAKQWGAEFEAVAQLTKDLRLGASFDYLHFKYTEFGPGVDPAALNATRYGNRPPRKYGVNMEYRLPLFPEAGELSARANWNWQAQSTGVPFGPVIPAFGLLNMSADWEGIYGHNVDLSLFVSNALDKTYSLGGFDLYSSLGITAQRFGEPRMYGLRVKYRFGP